MADSPNTSRLGPIFLQPGVRRINALTALFAAFVAIAMLAGINFLQSYILEVNLHVPPPLQGRVSGNLGFWTEIVALLVFTPSGILADRIGRRPVYIAAFLIIGLGYALYPFARSTTELLLCRMLLGVGVSAAASMLGTIQNDYAQERSRGKFIGLSGMMNVLGVAFMAGVLAHVPALLTPEGIDAVTAGRIMFLLATSLCFFAAGVIRVGLVGGTPVHPRDREDTRTLITAGIRAACNPRIALSYATAFAARADFVLKGMFLSLWAIRAGFNEGLAPPQAIAQIAKMVVIMQVAGLIWSPVFGWIMDRVNRVTATAIALTLASVGHVSMAVITSPLDFAMLPYFIVLTLGTSSMIVASLALIGQEAPVKERGTIIAMNGNFGALGILVLMAVGGRLFDHWGYASPFVAAGILQGVMLVAAIIIRIVSPGRLTATADLSLKQVTVSAPVKAPAN